MQNGIIAAAYNTGMVKKVLVIIAREGFQDHELAGVRNALKAAGFLIIIGSTRAGPCTGKFGSVENAETAIKDAIINDYDRTVFIGGPGALSLAERGDAKALAVETLAAGKILGAICIAPVILARAGVLNGRRATVWDSDGEQAALLKASGAIYTGEAVTVDGKIVTGNGPMAEEVFGKTFAELRIDTTSRLKRS